MKAKTGLKAGIIDFGAIQDIIKEIEAVEISRQEISSAFEKFDKSSGILHRDIGRMIGI